MKNNEIIVLALAILITSVAASQEAVISNPQPAKTNTASQTSSSLPDVALGEPLDWKLPNYPEEARKLNLQGDVVLMLHINEEGKVSESDVLSGPAELIGAVKDTLPKWSYIPHEIDGHPVSVITKVVVRFSIPKNGSAKVSAAFEMPKMPEMQEMPELGHIYKLGRGITAPKPIQTPEPEYSKQTRNDRFQGICVLEVVVGPDGRLYDIKVTRSLKKALDLKAVEALQKWRFEPARKDGKPVAVSLAIQVEFHLY